MHPYNREKDNEIQRETDKNKAKERRRDRGSERERERERERESREMESRPVVAIRQAAISSRAVRFCSLAQTYLPRRYVTGLAL